VDQIEFVADQGFTAWEDNGMRSRTEAQQEQIPKTLGDLGMQVGVFVADASFGSSLPGC
jgi:hydroxypyruvate isomerase